MKAEIWLTRLKLSVRGVYKLIQDIGTLKFHNEYKKQDPEEKSRILCYRNGEALVREAGDGQITFPTYRELQAKGIDEAKTDIYEFTYLFRIDEVTYFLIPEEAANRFPEGFVWRPVSVFRSAVPKDAAFAGITGYQLWQWYDQRKFCPRCGQKMRKDDVERMMRCPVCGEMEYPKISPAVIVAVYKGNQLLLTRYAGRAYKKYALIAGFTEIGETVEETVQREVMEEVGLHVKNLHYYKSQPWSFSSTLLMGFFAEADGEETIRLDQTELAEAVWCDATQIPEDDGVSLTREMMQVFKAHVNKKLEFHK